jgi:competence protein ComEC
VTKVVEERLIDLELKVDVVKIAHHGSNTSTSEKLISKLKPKYAIIQTGRIEKFGFPRVQTIETLNKYNVMILRTDKLYSIKYEYGKNGSIFTSIK